MRRKYLAKAAGCVVLMGLAGCLDGIDSASLGYTQATIRPMADLSGVVIDAVTEEPVAGARVEVATSTATTGETGLFSFTALGVGSHQLAVVATGYLAFTRVVVLSQGSNAVGQLRLIPDDCVPQCGERECGDNDCGGECGQCVGDEICMPDGDCRVCTPNCTDRECGDDGCNASCGSCDDGEICNPQGACEMCTANCSGRECGPDPVCGFDCGPCLTTQSCNDSGICETCTPNCLGLECGSDGCGGSCGDCDPGTCVWGECHEGPPQSWTCDLSYYDAKDGCDCECGAMDPDCVDPDQTLYGCETGETCNSAGHCVPCQADCDGRACGSDGCGGNCGECGNGLSCTNAGQCICVPDCVGKDCGSDGCGAECGTCGEGVCSETGQCCQPQCSDRQCGGDGCGGSCGACGEDSFCSYNGECVAAVGGPCDLSGAQTGAAWPMEGRCPSRQHRSPFTGPASAHLKFRYTPSLGAYMGVPATVDRTIFVRSANGRLYSFGLDGQVNWTVLVDTEVDDFRFMDVLPVAGGLVTVQNHNNVIKFGADGTQLWTHTVSVVHDVLVGNGAVYFCAGGGLIALDAELGEVIFDNDLDNSVDAGVVGEDGTIYVNTRSNDYPNPRTLRAFDVTGLQLWSEPIMGEYHVKPVVGPDGAIISAGRDPDWVEKISAAGERLWSQPMDLEPEHLAVAPDGSVYVGGDNGYFAVLESADGAVRWSTRYPVYDEANVAVGPAGELYVGVVHDDWNGTYTAIIGERDPRNGEEIWELEIPTTGSWRYLHPVVGNDGVLYIRVAGGLMAIAPDGTILWNRPAPGFPLRHSVAIDSSNRLIVAASAFDPDFPMGHISGANADGTEAFLLFAGYDVALRGSPAIGPSGMFVGDAGILHGFTLAGATDWTYESPGLTSSITLLPTHEIVQPSTEGKLLLVGQNGVAIRALDLGGPVTLPVSAGVDGTLYAIVNHDLVAITTQGVELWRHSAAEEITAAPSIGVDGTLYIGTASGRVLAVSPDGDRLWSFDTGDAVTATPAIGPQAHIYAASTDGVLHVLSPEGELLWQADRGSPIRGGALVDGVGKAFFGCDDGFVYGFDAEGNELWRLKTLAEASAPLSLGSNGTLYVPSQDGSVYAVENRTFQPVLINELFYNQSGEDGPEAFVEIHGPVGTPLDGWRLEAYDGTTGGFYDALPLTGAIGADGFFLIVHPLSSPGLQGQADIVDTFANLQNGPDLLLLIDAGGIVWDTVAYGTGGVDVGEGSPAPDAAEGQAISRSLDHRDSGDNATDFSVQSPTPRQ